MQESSPKTKCIIENFPNILKIKKRVIYNTMIKPQFNYCLLVWMLCSRKWNNLVNEVQGRALKLTYKDNENNFQTLLNKNNETSIHQRNLQFLMTEIHKTKSKPPSTHCGSCQFRENTFNLTNFRKLVTHNKKTSNFGIETVSCRASFLWAKSRSEYKNSTSLSEFKTKIKN